jgi:hypothetical protein
MTEEVQYDLIRRVEVIEDKLRKGGLSGSGGAVIVPGLQLLGDGTLFAQGGIAVGSGRTKIAEPFKLPVPTGLELHWGSSFDTIFIDVSWSAPAGYGADQVVSYLVEAFKTSDPADVPIETTPGSSPTRLQPVEPNTEYLVRVSGISRTGQTSSTVEDTITTGGDTDAPAAPTFPVSPVAEGVLALSIRWNPNAERDVANGKGTYRVVVSTHADLTSPVFNARQSGTNQWVGNLEAGTDYYVGVAAIDSSGNESPIAQPAGGPWTPMPNVTDTLAFAIGGGNVVRNSGFEDPVALSSWTAVGNGATLSKDTTTGHGPFGTSSLKITGTGDAWDYQDIALPKGTYVLSAWVKANAVAATTGTPTGVVLDPQMQSGAMANWAALFGTLHDGTSSYKVVGAGLGTYDWTRIAMRFDITTAGTLRVHLQRGFQGSCSGDAWFDEVQVEQGDTLTGYAPRPDEILSNTIQATMIADNQITTPKLAANSVVAGKIAADSIGANEIISRSITASEIATDTITSTEMAANSITTSELSANSVASDKIQANAVTTGHLQADSVTADKLAAISMVVGKFIQSGNYISNTQGWRIDGNGNAELNNVSIRGTINAARLGSDLFDFIRPGGEIAARFYFTGSQNRFYLGEGMVNADQYMYYDTVQARMFFKGGISNNPAWEFSQGVHFADWPYARRGYVCGRWTTGAGYFVGNDDTGNPDTSWGVAFGSDGGAGFTNFLQGYLDSTTRKVGIGNVNGGVGQVFIDCTSSNPADTRSLTRTGWITYSDPKSKSNIRALPAGASAKVRALKPIRYKVRHKAGNRMRVSSREHYGFSAEDVRDVLPEAVHEGLSFQIPQQDAEGKAFPTAEEDLGLGIQYDAFIPLLVQHNQELQDTVDKLAGRVAELESKGA